MKLLERTNDRLVFSLRPREKSFLERLLNFFPLRPDSRPDLSRGEGDKLEEATGLLHEALRDQRTELVEWIKRRLTEGEALAAAKGGWRLVLEAEEAERLLQVLNELRVGAWNKLGCPDELGEETLASTPSRAPLFAIMTLAGQFQMVLLHALHGDLGPGPRALD